MKPNYFKTIFCSSMDIKICSKQQSNQSLDSYLNIFDRLFGTHQKLMESKVDIKFGVVHPPKTNKTLDILTHETARAHSPNAPAERPLSAPRSVTASEGGDPCAWTDHDVREARSEARGLAWSRRARAALRALRPQSLGERRGCADRTTSSHCCPSR